MFGFANGSSSPLPELRTACYDGKDTQRKERPPLPAPLPQEFRRDLALLRFEDLEIGPESDPKGLFIEVFRRREADPLHPRGTVILGQESLRLFMALFRVMVLALRDINLERFPQQGGEGRLLAAYIKGENLAAPQGAGLERAAALFVERADLAPVDAIARLDRFAGPLFATWEGPAEGPVWEALSARCEVLDRRPA